MTRAGLLEGKVVIVTGAGSGIGRASALLFAREGAQVCLFDIDPRANAQTAGLLAQAGYPARCWELDVADEAAVEAATQGVVEACGKLDGAFNNAGIEMANKLVGELSLTEWQHLLGVNLTGVFLCMKHQTRAMAQHGGAIVNMSSGDGIIGQPYAVDYVASKHGVIGLTRGGACEARYSKVRVNAVLPGLILTPMVEERLLDNPAFKSQVVPMLERHSVGRFGKPEDVAEAACWLLSDRAAFINGAALTVDGGYTAR